jgi:uncharacterized protein YeaO (DUF488 family)
MKGMPSGYHNRREFRYAPVVIRLKRAFEKASPDDGCRVLVDRWWPKGVRKEALALEYWAKELSPSDAAADAYHENPRTWPEFRRRLLEELKAPAAQEALHGLALVSKDRPVTLIYTFPDPAKNNAAVVKEAIEACL